MLDSRNRIVLRTMSARLALGVILLCGCTSERPESPIGQRDSSKAAFPEKLELATMLHQRDQPAKALKVVQELLIQSPDDLDTLRLAIELLSQLGKYCEAGDLATKTAELDRQNAVRLLIRGFDWYLRCGDFASAEDSLNRAVKLDPNDVQVRRLLAQLLNAQGRRFEASEHVRQLIRLKAVQPEEILSLVDLPGPFFLVSFAELTDSSEVSLFSLGIARTLYIKNNSSPEEVLSLLDQVTQKFPGSTAAAAFRGRVLAETGRGEEFRKWLSQLPAEIEEQPEYWSAVGMWLEQQDRNQEAIRAFGEALRRDPTDRESLRAIVRALVSIGEEDQIGELRKRLADLDQIFRVAKEADAEQALWISQRLQELARPWEAAAWWLRAAQMSGQIQQQFAQLDKRHAAISAWEQGATDQQIREARLRHMLGFEIENWPMPRLDAAHALATQQRQIALEEGLRFEEIADQVEIAVPFISDFPVDGGEFRTYQVNGGGLAAFDYDLDGLCDLYLVQSGGDPNKPSGSTPNQLFRLLPNQRFREVTMPSGTGDRRFGQGICAGDVNQDGFPDLVVANIGPNTLYLNQGDGTFREASKQIESDSNLWTSCVAVADLDGDHLPEIVEVNYIDDPRAFTVKCERNYMDCQPQEFRKCADRVFRGLAEGKFVPWEAAEIMRDSPKLGFGLVIANFDREHGNDLFVANDGDLNHLWMSTADPSSTEARFAVVEAASVRGCSIGRGGESQACMGVASGDFDRNGTLDLHITNFRNQPVNLFLQTTSGYFSDEALKYQLVEPSFGVLGFGTQAADFDNDGWLDLAVLNGHVFDARFEDVPFRMQAQLLRGSQRGFALQDPAHAGQYWQKKQLGRTLATLDWNRDGRIDLVGNHLDAPLALLQNESPTQDWIQMQLVGTLSERDAIGAEVSVEAGSERWTGWQTGGDGYMCTNEQVVHLGLGNQARIDRIVVTWPSGTVQTFADVPPNARYLVIEGEPTLHRFW